jgi:hypothetical protein
MQQPRWMHSIASNTWLNLNSIAVIENVERETVDLKFRTSISPPIAMDIDADTVLLPNELAFTFAEKCQKWEYSAYSGEYDGTDFPRNSPVDRQYDVRVERAIADLNSKVQNQKRVLETVY